jgi:hypothetical protein
MLKVPQPSIQVKRPPSPLAAFSLSFVPNAQNYEPDLLRRSDTKAKEVKMKSARVIFVLALLIATMSYAAAADRVETIQFKRGATSTAVSGMVRGYAGVKYVVSASAGQVMSVLFSPSNRSCYMNVWAPASDTAVFVGSSAGNEYAVNLSASGNYAIQLYLMRNAARRNQTCSYHLTIEITGPPGGASAGVSDVAMKDRCKGEAAVMYGVEPRQIDVGEVNAVSGGFEIDGMASKGADGIKKLRCIFSASRSFDRIMAMTPDGE